jgi:hypothetical protein
MLPSSQPRGKRQSPATVEPDPANRIRVKEKMRRELGAHGGLSFGCPAGKQAPDPRARRHAPPDGRSRVALDRGGGQTNRLDPNMTGGPALRTQGAGREHQHQRGATSRAPDRR